jgi:hypothetical protein
MKGTDPESSCILSPFLPFFKSFCIRVADLTRYKPWTVRSYLLREWPCGSRPVACRIDNSRLKSFFTTNKSCMSRGKNHKIWQCPSHTFERQPGKKKDTNDYLPIQIMHTWSKSRFVDFRNKAPINLTVFKRSNLDFLNFRGLHVKRITEDRFTRKCDKLA